MNRRTLWIAICVALLLLGANVQGEENVEDDSGPAWSMGAGIGLGGWSWGSGVSYCGLGCLAGLASSGAILGGETTLGGYGGYAGIGGGWSPQGRVLVERQLSPKSALVFDGSFNYWKGISGGVLESSSKGLGLAIGWRRLFNPGGVVEVSAVGVLGANWSFSDSWASSTTDQGTTVFSFDSYSYSVGLQVGLVLERKLLDNLYLRLESSLGHVSYNWGEYESTNTSTQETSRSGSGGLSAGLALSPAIQLRMVF